MLLSLVNKLFASKNNIANVAENAPNSISYAPPKSFFTPKMILVLAGIIIVLYFIFSSKNKKKAEDKEKDKKAKKAAEVKIVPPEDPNKPISEEKKEDLEGFANALYQDMENTAFTGHRTELYKKFAGSYFTDNEFTLICDAFNKIDQVVEKFKEDEDEGFIRTWINSEVFWGDGATYQEQILERMDRLGIKL